MDRTKIGYLLLLMTVTLIGCGNSQIDGLTESTTHKADSVETANISRTPDNILFKGDNMTFIESGQNDFQQLNLDTGKNSCLNGVDENIKKKVSTIRFNGNTDYSQFNAVETNSFGSDKFTVKFDKELFSKINPSSLKKLDDYVGFTDSRYLYYIKDANHGYLLLIGHESATSGMGHYYRSHLLIPLESNTSVIEFQSISDDPRRIGITDSGAVYYIQIDPPYVGAIKDVATKSIELTVSLFTVNSMSNKRLETKFNLDCENLENALLK